MSFARRSAYRAALTAALLTIPAAALLAQAQRSVAPTWLYRYVPDVPEVQSDISSPKAHYKAVFGAGASGPNILRGVARYGELTVDAGGESATVSYPAEEQVYYITEGSGAVTYDAEKHPIRKGDFMFFPPDVKHSVSNDSGAPLRLIIMGWRIPPGTQIQRPAKFQIANIENVKKQVVGGHPPSTLFQLMVGDVKSTRDVISAGHVVTSVFIMEFDAGGTNFPHAHDNEEEIYLLLDGKGQMVAGGGMDGVEGKHPAKPGDAYAYRLNCTVGFYNDPTPGVPKAHILAARSLYPRGRRP